MFLRMTRTDPGYRLDVWGYWMDFGKSSKPQQMRQDDGSYCSGITHNTHSIEIAGFMDWVKDGDG